MSLPGMSVGADSTVTGKSNAFPEVVSKESYEIQPGQIVASPDAEGSAPPSIAADIGFVGGGAGCFRHRRDCNAFERSDDEVLVRATLKAGWVWPVLSLSGRYFTVEP